MNLPSSVLQALADAVGRVDAGGLIQPENAAMSRLLESLRVRTLAELTSLVGTTGQDFVAGAAVLVDGGDHHWRVQRCDDASGTWLLGRDISDEQRAASSAAANARARQLLQLAGSIVHDLCNHLSSGIGLASQLRAYVVDPIDLRLLDQLTVGSQQGVQLLRALVRMLVLHRGTREWVDLRQLLREGVAVVDKAARHDGVVIEVREHGDGLMVRTIAAEVLQALLAGLSCLLQSGATRIEAQLEPGVRRLAGGRARPCVSVRLSAPALPADAATSLVELLDARQTPPAGLVATSAKTLPLVEASLLMGHLGGELHVAALGAGVALDYWLPAPAGS